MASSTGESTPKKKKKTGRKIALILLALLLVAGIGVGTYVYSIGASFDKNTAKFEEAFPAEDGVVKQEVSKEFADKYVAEVKAAKVTESKEAGKTEEQIAEEEAATEAAIADAAEGGTEAITNESNAAALEENKSEIDSNGDGIPNAVSGGKTTSRPAATASTNILLLGSDSRGANNAEGVSGQRADTIMVLHVPNDGSDAYLISVMRDTWVNIPGYGSAKVNAGLNYGGVNLQVATIEQLLNIRIDHVAEIDFYGFKGLVDALGGITVNNPVAFYFNDFLYQAGPQQMNGEQALIYVRQRYQFADGDYQRVRNQRAFLRGVFNKIQSEGALSSVTKFKEIVDTVSPYMTVDSGLSSGQIVNIAQPVLRNGGTRLHMMTLPNAGTGWSWDGQSIVVLDSVANAALSEALRTNTMANFVAIYGED